MDHQQGDGRAMESERMETEFELRAKESERWPKGQPRGTNLGENSAKLGGELQNLRQGGGKLLHSPVAGVHWWYTCK